MKYYFAIFILIAIVAQSSCAPSKETINDISIRYQNDNLNIHSILESQEIIQLESTPAEAVISQINRVLLSENAIYIFDRTANKIVGFDKSGIFRCSTTGLIGRGGNEYIRIMDVAIDNIDKRLFVYCDAPYKILVLDYDLTVIDKIDLNELFLEIAVDNNYLYALTINVENETDYELRCYNKHDISRGYKKLLKQRGIAHVRPLGRSLWGATNSIYIGMPFDNTIYKLQNGNITDSWSLNFNGKWFEYEQSKHLKGTFFLDKCDNFSWSIQNICGSDSILFFNTNKSGIYEINIPKQIATYFKNTSSNIPSSTWIVPSSGTESTIVFSIPIGVMIKFIEYYQSRNLPIPTLPINKNLNQMQESDNPILVIGKLASPA